MKIISKDRWKSAQDAEMGYWEGVIGNPQEFLRILHEKIWFLNKIKAVFPQAIETTKDNPRALGIGIGPLGIGVASLLEPPGRWGITGVDPAPRKNSTYLPDYLQACWDVLSMRPMNYIQMPAENLNADQGKFDLIFCYNVLDHTENPLKIINITYNLLNPKGYFILAIDACSLLFYLRTKLFYKKYFDKYHPYKFTVYKIESMLKSNGYKIIWFEKRRLEDLKRICSRNQARFGIICQKPN